MTTASAADAERLTNIVGALAVAIADRVTAAVETASESAGAAPAALISLHDLLADRSVDDLRNAVDLTHSGGVRLVDRLVADGLVQRRPGVDGRSLALALTPRGRRVALRARDARRDALTEVLAVLDPEEQRTLKTIAEKLVLGLVEQRLTARAAGTTPEGGWLCRLCDPVACERADGLCPAANAAAGFSL